MISRLYKWLTLQELDEALHEARTAVIKRYARGNVTFQNGAILDEMGMERVRTLGNEAVEALEQQLRAYPNGEQERVRI